MQKGEITKETIYDICLLIGLKKYLNFILYAVFSNKIQLKLSFPRVKYSMRIQLEIDISIVLADSIRSEVDRQMWSS